MSVFRGNPRRFAKTVHCMVWLSICAFLLPAPMMSVGTVNAAPNQAYTGENPANAHVLRRLNSPERMRATEEAARIDATAREEFERSQTAARSDAATSVAPASPVIPAQAGELPLRGTQLSSALGGNEKALDPRLRGGDGGESRPQSVTEVLFNYGAGFMGVPGLTPQRDINGNYNEGLGFHQDGTVRRAGGTASGNGPSDQGQRARTYMQSGIQGGNQPGLPGGADLNAPGYGSASSIWEPGYDAATGVHWRGDPTRGGRISGFGANGYSRELSDFDPLGMALDRGLSYGAGLLNSMGEAAISGLVDGGRARLNFYLDREGDFGGEGDALLPFYDSQYSTAFVQLGGRSMHDEGNTRWIGNLGLGQRWFPAASEEDSGNWMVGYNAFFDYDLTREHQRGGIGVEAQYDWLRLASNYYFPLSSWRDSKDFDGDFVKERAAEGWDVRAKGYLPFYRNVAITGAYTQWYGDHVGMFGAANLEKDPKVWSYGLEYTPIPLVSGFVTQRSTERGRTDTEFGLNFTYHFQMPWEDQISHAKVAELRSVSGSRHEFVDRENRIILEYKAKNAYRIEYLGRIGANTFKFRIQDGFGKYKAGQTVRVSAGGGVTLAEAPQPEKSFLAQAGEAIVDFFSVSTAHAADFSQTYTSDRNGEFIVRLDDVTSTPVIVSIQAGNNTQSFTLAEAELSSGLWASASMVVNNGTVTLNLKTPDPNANISWNVTGPGQLITTPPRTDASGKATVTLTANATSSGPIEVTARVNNKDYTCIVTIGVSYSLAFGSVSGNTGPFTSSQTATIPVTLLQNGAVYTTPTQVTWSIASANNSANEAVVTGYKNKATGLTWGGSATSPPDTELTATRTSTTDTSGNTSIQLTDIMGERTVTVQASVTIGGQTYTNTQPVTFGAGLLAVFKAPLSDSKRWADNSPISSSSNSAVSNFPAADACGTSLNAAGLRGLPDGYHAATKLPSVGQLQAVSMPVGNGAWQAAGWPDAQYRTGQVINGGTDTWLVTFWGQNLFGGMDYDVPVVCLR